MADARELIGEIERSVKPPSGTDEGCNGYGVMGLPAVAGRNAASTKVTVGHPATAKQTAGLPSGHVLNMRRYAADCLALLRLYTMPRSPILLLLARPQREPLF